MNKRLKNSMLCFLISVAIYIALYATLSMNGEYRSEVSGLHRGNDEKMYLKEKVTYAKWFPFEFYDLKGVPKFKYIVYFPLIWIDRKFIHNGPSGVSEVNSRSIYR